MARLSEKQQRLVRQGKCPDCGGTGAEPLSDTVNFLPCRSCGGTGLPTAAYEPTTNPLLMGTAEEIDLLRPEIRSMIENEGVYVCGDSKHPEYTVPIISMGGRLFSIQIDTELDPERFLDTVTIAGPFHKPDAGESDDA